MIKLDKINTVSNYLSFLRILLVAPIIIFLNKIELGYEYRIITVGIMIIAAATDYLDGYYARKLNQISELGKIIDPLADKVAVGLITIYLFILRELPEYLFYIIVLRDLFIFTGGIIVSNKVGKVLPSNMLGKITVTVIGIYLIAIILGVKEISWLNDFLIFSTIAFSILSLAGYILRASEILRYHKNENF